MMERRADLKRKRGGVGGAGESDFTKQGVGSYIPQPHAIVGGLRAGENVAKRCESVCIRYVDAYRNERIFLLGTAPYSGFFVREAAQPPQSPSRSPFPLRAHPPCIWTQATPELLSKATNLKVIGRAGVGIDNIDVAEATRKGVLVMNTPGGNTVSTAQLAISLLCAAARYIHFSEACDHHFDIRSSRIILRGSFRQLLTSLDSQMLASRLLMGEHSLSTNTRWDVYIHSTVGKPIRECSSHRSPALTVMRL